MASLEAGKSVFCALHGQLLFHYIEGIDPSTLHLGADQANSPWKGSSSFPSNSKP